MSNWHVFPVDDLVDHDAEGEDCVCGPRVDAILDNGPDDWIYVHHSLDGRELKEESA